MRLFGRSGVDNSGNDSDRETCKTTVKLLYWPSFQQIMVILVGHCRNSRNRTPEEYCITVRSVERQTKVICRRYDVELQYIAILDWLESRRE